MQIIKADTPAEAIREVIKFVRGLAEQKRTELRLAGTGGTVKDQRHTGGITYKAKLAAVAAMLDYIANSLEEIRVVAKDATSAFDPRFEDVREAQ